MEIEWRVTWEEGDLRMQNSVPNESQARAYAAALAADDGIRDVRVWRRQIPDWEPAYQSMFPGEDA